MQMLVKPAELARALDVAAVPARLGPHDDARHATERILVQATHAGALFTGASRSLVARTLAPSYATECYARERPPFTTEIDGTNLRYVLSQLKGCPHHRLRLQWVPEGLALHTDPTEPLVLLRERAGTDARRVADVGPMLETLPEHGGPTPGHDGPVRVKPAVLQRLTAALGRHSMDPGLLAGLSLSPTRTSPRPRCPGAARNGRSGRSCPPAWAVT
ncbi:hypothetical protein M3B61_10010 [Micrococcus luteus]|nr:hypothetical protein [Micrococcus luteus]MCV7583871.1 hypothetical protein [Micrococcus luteus]MCV7588311.1 hypothetical protein [Micrococcus luteus]